MSVLSNISRLKWYYFLGTMWPMSSVVIVYFQQITGSYTTAMSIYAICSLVQTFMEVPSGIISDKYPRSKVLVATSLAILGCFIFWAMAGIFSNVYCLVLGAILYGLNSALSSGTVDAFIYETVKDLKREKEFGKVFSEINMYAQVGLTVGALLAALVLYYGSMSVLAVVSIIPALIQTILAMLFVEPKRLYVNKNVTSLKYMVIALRRIFRNKSLFWFAVIRVVESSVETTIHRFEAAYFKTVVSASMIAIIRVFKQVFGALGFYLYSFVAKFSKVKVYLLALSANTLFRAVAVGLNNVLSPFVMAFVNLFYGATTTSSVAIIQDKFSSQQRATLQSILSLVVGVVVALMMFLFGVLADMCSTRMAIACAILLKLVVIVISSIVLKKRVL